MVALFVTQSQAASVPAPDPKITIEYVGGKKTFTRKQLLKHKDLATIVVEKDPSHPELSPVAYSAVPMSALLEGIPVPKEAKIQSYASDGFSSPIDRERLLAARDDASRAYLAIESADKPWPKMGNGRTAGPYYLIWTKPELSKVDKEEWVFELTRIRISPKDP